MPAPTPPIQPTAEQALRYRQAFSYVFCMLRRGDTAHSVENKEGSYVSLKLNPQQISFREPFATAVTPTQGGGKVIESRGQIIKTISISGTTGYLYRPTGTLRALPSSDRRQSKVLIEGSEEEDARLALISGYYEFHRLRYLFRNYGYERRLGKTDVQLHYFDFKNEDFWRIEPEEFSMIRSARKPYSYDYNISFKCIEPSQPAEDRGGPDELDWGTVSFSVSGFTDVATLRDRPVKAPGLWKEPPSKLENLTSGITAGLTYTKHLNGELLRGFQKILTYADAVVGFFENVPDTVDTLSATPFSLIALLNSSVNGFQRTLEKYEGLVHTGIAVYNFVALWELNAWWVQMRTTVDYLAASVGLPEPFGRDPEKVNTSFSSSRMIQGARTDLLKDPNATDDPSARGVTGLELVTDVAGLASTRSARAEVIGTGEDIYALARRLLGDVQRFVDLVILNDLEAPYIVADSAARPANTLAWGDRILVPSDAPGGGMGGDEAPVPASVGGPVTGSGTASQLVDLTASWLPDQWIGYTLTATTGADSQSLVVTGNTATVLQLNTIWSITITPGITTYALSMITFNARLPVDPEAKAYGSDLLLVFDNKNQADIMIGQNRDLARVRGRENLVQAVQMRAMTEIKEHPFHPSYGINAPIGRPFTADIALLYSYFIKQSLQADPRIAEVRHVQLTVQDGVFYLSADIQPIQARRPSPVRVALG